MNARDGVGPAQIVRVASPTAGEFQIFVDGASVPAMQGESLIVAILAARRALRRSKAAGEERAGFCLMGACQECWVWLDEGTRVRACTTRAQPSMRIWTAAPPGWPKPPAESAI